MGGLAFRAPVLAALFLIVALATLAMPGSANFVGEFLILTGVFKAKIVYAIVAGAGVVLAAVYMIRLYQRSMHNPLARRRRVARDEHRATAVVIVPIVAVILVARAVSAVRAASAPRTHGGDQRQRPVASRSLAIADEPPRSTRPTSTTPACRR